MAATRNPVEKIIGGAADELLRSADCRSWGSFWLVADLMPSWAELTEMGLNPYGTDSFNIQVCIFADFDRDKVLRLACFPWVSAVLVTRVT